MKIRFFFVSIFSLLLTLSIYSQNSNLYIPRNIQDTYKNKTRSIDGNPGENYWQNGSEYKIFAEVDPNLDMVKGIEKITYHNNSSDDLSSIVIRLYQDIYKKGNARDWPMPADAINDGVNISKLIIAGKEIAINENPKVKNTGTNLAIKLDSLLKSKTDLALEIEWSVKIPDVAKLRMGKYDSTSYYVAYWYPQMAVYDDIDGWDYFNYGGTMEFYNDFSNYEVEVTVPEGYVVWATGVLQNPKEVLKKDIYERYELSKTVDTVVNVAAQADYENGIVTAPKKNTYKFSAKNVTDFTFATSDHYLWDATSVIVDKTSGRRASVSSAYKKESKDFYGVAKIAADAIKYFSEDMPAVPYPYPEMTVFNGSGGMESPMMVNNGSFSSQAATVGVTSHEIAHTYFPFYMGINERKYAFMDEGWAVMLPTDFQSMVPGNDVLARNTSGYSKIAGLEDEVPLSVPSNQLRSAYRRSAYSRSSAAYYALRNLLGEKLFLKGLHEYMTRWNGKHPMPYDFYFSFEQGVGQDLSWFWNPWFLEQGYPDLGIKGATYSNKTVSVTIERIGNIPVPIYFEIKRDWGKNIVVQKSAEVWKNGDKQVTIDVELKDGKPIKILLGNLSIPDSNVDNNQFSF